MITQSFVETKSAAKESITNLNQDKLSAMPDNLRLYSGQVIQPKLTIGPPDDPYEKEADQMADTVMRMPENNFIRRKCAGCDEDGKISRKIISPFIQTKSNENNTASNALSQSISSSKGTGQILSSDTASFMSSRFGSDFSSVKIHTGTDSVQMNRELNAQAFTTGSDIYFNEGKYQPHTSEGKHLLAHELTHVVQQNPSIQRKNAPDIQPARDPSFEIADLYPGRASEPNFVFFDIAKPDIAITDLPGSLDAAERTKIRDRAAAAPAAISLFGFASEEGTRAENDALIGRRVEAVKQSLVNDNYPIGQINTSSSNQRISGVDQFNYRFWRSVEMSTSGTSARQRPPGAAAARGMTACPTNRRDIADARRTDAITLINSTITKLNEFSSAPADHANVLTALDFYFHNHTNGFISGTLIPRLESIRTFLNRMMSILLCGDQFSQDCGTDVIAMTSSTTVKLCEGFFSGLGSEQERTTVLLHESGHGARTDIGDRGYRHERVFRFLTTAQAVRNADSFAMLIDELETGTRSSEIVAEDLDSMHNCDSNPALRDHIRETIAWTQRLNTYAFTGIQQTYANDAITDSARTGFINNFGRVDRTAMAGILDRYFQMRDILQQPLQITCIDPSDPICSSNPLPIWTTSGHVSVCPSHLNQSTRDARINQMYAGLAAILPGVTPTQRLAYPRLARFYKNEIWQQRG